MKKLVLLVLAVLAIVAGGRLWKASGRQSAATQMQSEAAAKWASFAPRIRNNDAPGEYVAVTWENVGELAGSVAVVLHHAPATEISPLDEHALTFAESQYVAILQALALYDSNPLAQLDIRSPTTVDFVGDIEYNQKHTANYNWSALNTSASQISVWDLNSQEYMDWKDQSIYADVVEQSRKYLDTKPFYLLFTRFQVEHAGNGRNFLEFFTVMDEAGGAFCSGVTASNPVSKDVHPVQLPAGAAGP